MLHSRPSNVLGLPNFVIIKILMEGWWQFNKVLQDINKYSEYLLNCLQFMANDTSLLTRPIKSINNEQICCLVCFTVTYSYSKSLESLLPKLLGLVKPFFKVALICSESAKQRMQQ